MGLDREARLLAICHSPTIAHATAVIARSGLPVARALSVQISVIPSGLFGARSPAVPDGSNRLLWAWVVSDTGRLGTAGPVRHESHCRVAGREQKRWQGMPR